MTAQVRHSEYGVWQRRCDREWLRKCRGEQRCVGGGQGEEMPCRVRVVTRMSTVTATWLLESAMSIGRILLAIASLTVLHGEHVAKSNLATLMPRKRPFPHMSVSRPLSQFWTNTNYWTDFSHLKALGTLEGRLPRDVRSI